MWAKENLRRHFSQLLPLRLILDATFDNQVLARVSGQTHSNYRLGTLHTNQPISHDLAMALQSQLWDRRCMDHILQVMLLCQSIQSASSLPPVPLRAEGISSRKTYSGKNFCLETIKRQEKNMSAA